MVLLKVQAELKATLQNKKFITIMDFVTQAGVTDKVHISTVADWCEDNGYSWMHYCLRYCIYHGYRPHMIQMATNFWYPQIKKARAEWIRKGSGVDVSVVYNKSAWRKIRYAVLPKLLYENLAAYFRFTFRGSLATPGGFVSVYRTPVRAYAALAYALAVLKTTWEIPEV